VVREGVFIGQLQVFLEVARLGSVTRAADVLFLTQPALTARLKRLEQELGVSLLVRNRRGARLTEAGRGFLEYAERAVSAMDDGQNALGELGRSVAGDLVLGAVPSLSAHVLPAVIRRFVEAFPSVRLTVDAAPSDDILQKVLQGTVHVGLGRIRQHPEVECRALYDDELIVVADPRHPRATAGPMRMADFAHERLILFNSSSSGEFTKALQRQAGVAARAVIDVNNHDTSRNLVSEGIGLGLLLRATVRTDLAEGRLCHIPVLDMPPMRRTMATIRRRGATESGSARAFLRLLDAYISEAQLAPKRSTRRPH
jgi:DNA-binding transcriptional LysR family regulator